MGKPVTVCGKSFGSKTEAEDHIRAILARYGNMETLRGDDLLFAFALIESHPNRHAIVDCGIKTVVVQHLRDKYDSRRFVAIRDDSSIRDFTWRHALYPRSARARVMKACRWAVKDQIRKFREKEFSTGLGVCPVSGLPVTPFDSDVDHIPPQTFEKLVEAWLSTVRLADEDIELVAVAGYGKPDRWQDVFLEEDWKAYHRTHARLRVVHPTANRSTIRKEANVAK